MHDRIGVMALVTFAISNKVFAPILAINGATCGNLENNVVSTPRSGATPLQILTYVSVTMVTWLISCSVLYLRTIVSFTSYVSPKRLRSIIIGVTIVAITILGSNLVLRLVEIYW